jgi:hypothetical protein
MLDVSMADFNSGRHKFVKDLRNPLSKSYLKALKQNDSLRASIYRNDKP